MHNLSSNVVDYVDLIWLSEELESMQQSLLEKTSDEEERSSGALSYDLHIPSSVYSDTDRV